MKKFSEYVSVNTMTFDEEMEEWNQESFLYFYDIFASTINEVHNRPVYPEVIKNIPNEFVATITGDLASIMFYEKEKKKVGAIGDKSNKTGALTGVLESITLLLKHRSDVNRVFAIAVDKKLESYNDTVSKWIHRKIKNLEFDYSERDVHGRKCYWYYRKE